MLPVLDERSTVAPPVAGQGERARAAGGASGRMLHVDGLRGMAALWVALLHAQESFLPHWQNSPIVFFVGAGGLGVPMFLVLSGFCLAYPVLSRGRFHVELRSYAIRRALRILPPYYIVMIGLSGLQQLPLVAERTVREVTDLPDFLTHLFLVHNLWPDHIVRISGPFWSIALECQLYVLFPLLLVSMKRPWVPMAGAVAVAGAWWLASPHLLGPSPFNVGVGTGQGDAAFAYWNSLPSLLPLFVLGMGAAWMLAGPRGGYPHGRRRQASACSSRPSS